MSEIEIKVPELSESVSSAEVLGWKVKPGDPVEEDQVLVELETDKVVLEVSAPCDGVVTEILVKEGDTVKTGDVVAKVEEGAAKAENVPAAAAVASVPAPEPAPAPEAAAPAAAPAPAAKPAESRVMPSALRAAAEAGIDARALQGTGVGGRVTKADVEAKAAALPTPAPVPAPAAPAAAAAPAESPVSVFFPAPHAVSRDTSRVASAAASVRLNSSLGTAAVTLFEKVDVTSLFDLIESESASFEAREGVPLEASAVFAAALSRTAEAFPAIAPAAASGAALVNLAVDTALGTIYPAVVASRREGIAGLLRRLSDLKSRAEAGSLTPQELSLGDITLITGRGAGTISSTPAVTPPQAATLAVHRAEETAVWKNGTWEPRRVAVAALSFDSRMVERETASDALLFFRSLIENPVRIFL
jgi:2-oxoglutarate dehydrogenase E2 component (dihydrolipoamide succinyltransferase)